MPFITLNNYIKKDFENCKYKDKYTFKEFKETRMRQFGYFAEWLSEFKNESLTKEQWKSVVKSYIDNGHRDFKDIPGLMTSISRTHNIEIPPIEGILTEDYWKKKLSKEESLELA